MSQKSIHVRFQTEQLAAIEQFRRAEADLPTKPEMIRRLVERATREVEPRYDDDRCHLTTKSPRC